MTTATKPARTRRAAEPTAAPPAAPKSHTTFHHDGVTVKPSVLPPALTGFVCDAVVLSAELGMPWNDTARLVGYVRLAVGTVLAYDPALVRKLYEAEGRAAFRCSGKFNDLGELDYRGLGGKVLTQFAGYPLDGDDVYVTDLVPALQAMLGAQK